MRALFLTWDGPEQTYLESLFFPIFEAMRRQGIEVHVLQLTWAKAEALGPVASAARARGIGYSARRIPHRLRLAGLPFIVAYGAVEALRVMKARRIGTLFPRSLVPMAMALLARRLRPALDLVFDADGFMADERLDFAGYRETGAAYRLLRWVEANGVQKARAVICRTQAAARILSERAGGSSPSEKIFVAPNGKDSELFQPQTATERSATRGRWGIAADAPWVVYVGSLGPQYCPELMFDIFERILERLPHARLSLLSGRAAAFEALARERGLSPSVVTARAVAPAEVSEVLAAADLGLALRKESFSQRGVSPIKVAEYLLCGLPVVASRVGDLSEQLGGAGVAHLLDTADADAGAEAAAWFVNEVMPKRDALREQARELGLRFFALSDCAATYTRAFRFATGEAS